MAGQVDELVPVSRGGSPYDLANCATAHACCNNWRKAKPVREVEAIRSQVARRFGGWSDPLDFVRKANALGKKPNSLAAAPPPTTTTDW